MTTIASTKRQHLNVRGDTEQMEMQPDNTVNSSALSDDFESKLKIATEQLETLQRKQEELELERVELQELSIRKEEFLQRQLESNEKLSTSLTGLDRELFEMRQEVEDLEQTRSCFAANLEKVENLDPANWQRENLRQELNKAISTLDQAEDEYDEAVEHFVDSRSRLFAANVTSKRKTTSSIKGYDFTTHFKNGLAFNLPLIIVGIIAVLIYINR